MTLPTYATTNLQTQDYRTSAKPARPTCDCGQPARVVRHITRGTITETWRVCQACDERMQGRPCGTDAHRYGEE